VLERKLEEFLIMVRRLRDNMEELEQIFVDRREPVPAAILDGLDLHLRDMYGLLRTIVARTYRIHRNRAMLVSNPEPEK
jgi:hypothetical protein